LDFNPLGVLHRKRFPSSNQAKESGIISEPDAPQGDSGEFSIWSSQLLDSPEPFLHLFLWGWIGPRTVFRFCSQIAVDLVRDLLPNPAAFLRQGVVVVELQPVD
jgi:hypothetical protein